jgi:hypothetical protein
MDVEYPTDVIICMIVVPIQKNSFHELMLYLAGKLTL